jgi:CheY-like chemotaxis protein
MITVNHMYRVLQIEDLPSDAYLVSREVKKVLDPCEFRVVDDLEAFMEALKNFRPHIIISDYSLPGFNWHTALVLTIEHTPQTPFIVVSGSGTKELKAECFSAGVKAYINKNSIRELGPALLDVMKDQSDPSS